MTDAQRVGKHTTESDTGDVQRPARQGESRQLIADASASTCGQNTSVSEGCGNVSAERMLSCFIQSRQDTDVADMLQLLQSRASGGEVESCRGIRCPFMFPGCFLFDWLKRLLAAE